MLALNAGAQVDKRQTIEGFRDKHKAFSLTFHEDEEDEEDEEDGDEEEEGDDECDGDESQRSRRFR